MGNNDIEKLGRAERKVVRKEPSTQHNERSDFRMMLLLLLLLRLLLEIRDAQDLEELAVIEVAMLVGERRRQELGDLMSASGREQDAQWLPSACFAYCCAPGGTGPTSSSDMRSPMLARSCRI